MAGKPEETEEVVDRGDVIADEKTEEAEAQAEEKEVAAEGAAESGEPDTAEPDEDAGAAKEPMLPKSRYDSVRRRNEALQAKIDKMEREREARLEAVKEQDVEPAQVRKQEEVSSGARIIELDDLITDALLDGDKALANKYRTEQRDLEREVMREELQMTSLSAASQAREQVALDATVDFLEATYDELNPNNEQFNQKVVEELEGLRHAFQSTGEYSASQALLKAAKYMFPDMSPEDIPADTKNKNKGAIEKATKAASKQPPDLKEVGSDSDTAGIREDIDPSKLTERDLDTLPEATLARLRGDIL